MAIHEYRGGGANASEHTGSLAVLTTGRERLAVVSTSHKLCGIAAYTDALEKHLGDVFDVTVFDLDQYLLRSRHPRVRTLADHHVKAICREIAGFDLVSLQLEYGTLGHLAKDICRRFCWLIEAAPRLSVTFHTLTLPPGFPHTDLIKAVVTGKFRAAGNLWTEFHRNNRLSVVVAKRLRSVQRRKPVSVIVHNRRDASHARYLYGFKNVFDHPLTFLSPTEIDAVANHASRRQFPLLDQVPPEAKLVGVFGFLNDYKGFSTVVRALHNLPKDYHLLIFGGVHPNEIAPHQRIHPYLSSLFDAAYFDTTLYDQLGSKIQQQEPRLTFRSELTLTDLLGDHPRDVSARVHFMGALEDGDFLTGMAICDTIVFPYLEVGQSASGPISQALELGRRIIASRTHTFLAFGEYHKDRIEFFDIGNHLELAERILARPQYAARRERLAYNVETNKAIYLAANSRLANAPSRFRRHRSGRARSQLGESVGR